MKSQIFKVQRSTLLPSNDMVEVQLNYKSRGSDQIKGVVVLVCRPDEAPKVGDEVTVTVTWEKV